MTLMEHFVWQLFRLSTFARRYTQSASGNSFRARSGCLWWGLLLYCNLISILNPVLTAVDIKVTYLMFKDFTVAVLASPDLYVYGSTSQGLAALCDIVITASLIYFLHSARSGVHSLVPTQRDSPVYRMTGHYRTGVLIDNLILYAVTRGTLTAICQLMFMTLNVAFPDHTYWQPFHQAVGKPSLNFRTVHEGSRKALPMRRSTAQTDLAFDSDGAANGSNADTEMNASKNTKQVVSFPTGLGTSTSTRIAERKEYSPS
ncbi:hypothetical protein BDZ89DRAFT_1139177 [Hymenopellis radicata]|nr:hypothetical protein BDZ89DRAFT_1139177 [Hymenopellis radicata]